MRNQSQFRRISGRGRTWLICPVCNKQFSRPNAHIRGTTSCCSQTCSKIIKPKKQKIIIDYVCQGCGKTFQKRKGYSGPCKYCSVACARKFSAPRGEKHIRWKGGISERTHAVRMAIKEKLKEIQYCERCGASDHLHGHHKKSYADYPELRTDLTNIEILCVDCHAKEHPTVSKLLLSRVYTSQKSEQA